MSLLDTYLLLMFVCHACLKGIEAHQEADMGTAHQEDVQTDGEKMAINGEHLVNHLADIVDLGGEGLRHIQEHLNQGNFNTEQFSQDIEAIRNGDDTKGIFYFFTFHDSDKNDRLDGLELFHALTHYVNGGKSEEEDDGHTLLEDEVESLVDNLLQKHDLNHDGYIEYTELMNSDPDSLWNKLGSNVKGNDEGDQE